MSNIYYTDTHTKIGFPAIGSYAVSILSCIAILWTIWQAAITFGAVDNPTNFMNASVAIVGAALGFAVAWLDTN